MSFDVVATGVGHFMWPQFEDKEVERKFLAYRFRHTHVTIQAMTALMTAIASIGLVMSAPDLWRGLRVGVLIFGYLCIIVARELIAAAWIDDLARAHSLYTHAAGSIYMVSGIVARMMSGAPVLPLHLTSALQFVAVLMLRVHHFECQPRLAIIVTLISTNMVNSIPLQLGIVAAGEATGWLLEREVRGMYARGGLEQHSSCEGLGDSREARPPLLAPARRSAASSNGLSRPGLPPPTTDAPLAEMRLVPTPAVTERTPAPVYMPKPISPAGLLIDWTTALGRGGMATVYPAMWQGTQVAVKVTHSSASARRSSLLAAHLQEEANVLTRLRHPCICSIFGCVLVDGGAYGGGPSFGEAIVLEYLEGGSLYALLHTDEASFNCETH